MSSTFSKYSWTSINDVLKLREHDYVVLDFETTGLSPEKAKIIEVALARVRSGNICDEFVSLVNPQESISKRITSLTGITTDDVSDAPLFTDIAHRIVDFIGDATILAHNASFDIAFLKHNLNACGVSFKGIYFDTLALARKALPALKNHKLETIIKHMDISDAQTHRALDDVHCTKTLFEAICTNHRDPLTIALQSCCTPLDGCQIAPNHTDLLGKSFVFIGKFTFPYSSARKAVLAAGGNIVKTMSADTNYLVRGYYEQSEDSTEYDKVYAHAISLQNQGSKIQVLNEIMFLQLCGVTLTCFSSRAGSDFNVPQE